MKIEMEKNVERHLAIRRDAFAAAMADFAVLAKAGLCITPLNAETPPEALRAAQDAYLADILARIADHPSRRIDDLLPWNWKSITMTMPGTAAAIS